MADNANISSQGQPNQPGQGPYIVPQEDNEESLTQQMIGTKHMTLTKQMIGTQHIIKPGESYFTDTQASQQTDLQQQINTQVRNMPVPPPLTNGQIQEATSPGVLGNRFLTSIPLVAFFINFNLIANIYRQMSVVEEKLNLLEIALVTDLAHSEAKQILRAAKAEHDMYFAAAIGSLAEGTTSLAMGFVQFGAQRRAKTNMASERKSYQEDVNKKEEVAKQRQIEYGQSGSRVSQARSNLTNKQADTRKLREDGAKDTDEAMIKAKKAEQRAQARLDKAEQTEYNSAGQRRARRNLDKAEEDHDEAVQHLKRHDARAIENSQSQVQSMTLRMQMYTQAFNKYTDAAVNFAKASFALEKGRAEAEQKMLAVYQQTAFKMMDTLNNSKNENSKLIGDIFQQLRKISDDYKRLGSSFTAAAGA